MQLHNLGPAVDALVIYLLMIYGYRQRTKPFSPKQGGQHSHGATSQLNTPEKQFTEPARVRVTAQAS